MDTIDKDVLLRYLQGKATDTDYQIIAAWIGENDDNKQTLFNLEILFASAKREQLSDAEYIGRQRKKLSDKIRSNENDCEPSKPKIRYRTILRITACVAAVLLVAIWGYNRFHPSVENIAGNTITVENEHEKVKIITLEDGTKVWLNTNSSLTYPTSFAANKREVKLNGEGYFDVIRDSIRPFVVHSNMLRVKVLGTSFNLAASTSKNTSSVTLISGEIEVKGNNNEGHITLLPGQKAELDHLSSRLRVYEVNAVLDAVWHNDLIQFNNATILEIEEALEYIYKVDIYINPSVSVRQKYSGVIKKRESVDSVLNSLMLSIPINYHRKGDKIYINQKTEIE